MDVSDKYSFYENISDELEYLEKIRGPKYLSLTLVVPVTLTYVIIFVTGFVGNVITCIVIWRNPTMQTPTNYYLFNLAVSDLLFLILGLPFELSVFWQQYPWQWGLGICKLRAYVSETSSYVSVLTIMAFSVERYLAIYHPLRHYGSGLKRSIRSIFGAWLIALIFAIPFAAYIDIDYVEYPQSAVVITFFICWAPFHIQRLLYVYEDSTYDDINQWVYPLTGCLYYFSTTINPILYNVMSAKYRNAFKETCRCSPSNPSISRVGLSSMRDSSTICGVRPSQASQVFRERSVNSQRHGMYSASDPVENKSHEAAQLQADDGEDEKRTNNVPANYFLTADKNTNEIGASRYLQQTKRSSILIHAKNRRLKYQVSDEDETPSNETHI
ncbi:neuropeptides capa receptor-like isoform X2 [Bombus bifarius]|uniref:Neuropeptides capa receptor-like isoform X2 n=1 Tax=Bombus bifarius TaxID=103933 RepID=A0A6P8LTU9_9HYME|nr:neuropeptides capa receptor-like isoform X2 [Bombus bifarius]